MPINPSAARAPRCTRCRLQGEALISSGTEPRQINHRLRKVFVQGDVPVGIVLLGERLEADGLQFVEHRQAQLGGLGVARVFEGREDVGVLVAGKAICLGDHGVDGGAGAQRSSSDASTGHVRGIFPSSRQASPSCSCHNDRKLRLIATSRTASWHRKRRVSAGSLSIHCTRSSTTLPRFDWTTRRACASNENALNMVHANKALAFGRILGVDSISIEWAATAPGGRRQTREDRSFVLG